MTPLRRSHLVRAARNAAVALTLLALGAAACGDDDDAGSITIVDDAGAQTADYEFLIPDGTGLQIDRGEPVEILPGRLDVKVGEVIRIVNEDDRGHLVGPFFVGAGETLTQRFASAGEFIGACSVHPSGQLILAVSE